MNVEAEPSVTGVFLLLEPGLKLFGRVRGSMIQNEDQRLDLTTQGFGNDLLCDKSLEIGKACAASAGSIDLAISDGKPSKQMAGATTMLTRFMQGRLARTSRARRPLAFTSLDGGFLIQADQPGACLQKCSGLSIGFQHGTRALEEGDWIMDGLPAVIAPGAQTVGFEPTAHCAG